MSGAPLRYDIPKQAPAVFCRTCGSSIVFVQTPKGHRMPVEGAGEKRGEPHWGNCNDPKRFRKRDRVKGASTR